MSAGHNALKLGALRVNDALRKLFFDSDTELHILSAADSLNTFNVVAILSSGWWLEYDNYRKNFRLEVIDVDDEMQLAMESATHVRIDDDVYAIDAADVTPPKGTDVAWKIRCDRYTRRGQYAALY